MINYKMLMFFCLFVWGGAALVTGAVTSSQPGDAGGSAQSVQDFGNTVFAGQEARLDRPVATGNNPVSAALSFGNAAVGWVTFLFNSATLDSPIWEGWAQPIRWTILLLQLPMLLLLTLEGARILSGFIPFT